MDASLRPGKTVRIDVRVVEGDEDRRRRDELATEEPLEIRLSGSGRDESLQLPSPLAVTMRTPGNDFELVAGFLFTEGIVQGPEQILQLKYCTDPAVDGPQQYNIVSVVLRDGVRLDPSKLQRNFYTTSSCGICGKASIDALEVNCSPAGEGPVVPAEVIRELPDRLREAQSLFERTGGIHAAGVFEPDGRLLAIREDVGRHNAVDKVIGEAFLNRKLPLSGKVLMVSGRASFEIMQKAAAAGAPFVVAVSAPSSLAVQTARRFNMTLVGFVRGARFNVYAGEQRVAVDAGRPKQPGGPVDRRVSKGLDNGEAPPNRAVDRSAVPMLSVVGASGSGKTTLIGRLIRELDRRGFAVGVIKRSHHPLEFDRDGKDSARLLESGAAASMAAGPDLVALTVPADGLDAADTDSMQRVLREASRRLDLILVEGFKQGPLPKVLVEHPKKAGWPAPEELSELVAVVSDTGGARSVQQAGGPPRFSRDDTAALVDVILSTLGLDSR